MAASKSPGGARLSHLVLNVRDIEASHRFYTEVLGYEQCAEMTHTMEMRFYRSDPDHHHDLALVQIANPASYPPPQDWSMMPDRPAGVNHIAIAFGERENWLAQLRHMASLGVQVHVRGNHGMTHSAYISDPDGHGIEVLYDLPPEVWEGDVDAALNYFEFLPNSGDGALDDATDYQRFGDAYEPAVAVPGRVLARVPR